MIGIKFLNILHHYEPYNYFEITGNNESSYKKGIKEFLRFSKQFFLSIINIKGLINLFKLKNKTIFYVGTINQYNSIKEVQKNTPNSQIVSIRYKSKQLSRFKNVVYINSFLAYIFSMITFPYFLYEYITENKRSRFRYRFFFYEHFLSTGLDIYWYLVFKFFKPKKVIIANELKSEYRTIALNAKKLKIKSFYIAHGVTFDFYNDLKPICDFYLLSGKYEFEHYTKNNPNVEFYFVGRPLYDSLKVVSPRKEIKNIGICTNSLSNILLVENLIEKLKDNCGAKIYFRPHPGHNEDKESTFCKKHNLIYSNSNRIKSNTFISEIDLLISGESSIIIEAVYAGVYSVIYPFDNKFSDLQKFVSNKVSKYCDNFEQLISFLESLDFDFIHVQKYVYNQFYPLSSSEAITKIINEK